MGIVASVLYQLRRCILPLTFLMAKAAFSYSNSRLRLASDMNQMVELAKEEPNTD